MNGRVEKLKKEMLAEKRFLSVEQAKIISRVHKEKSAEPLCIRRALALAAAFDEMNICIKEGELIVGSRTTGVRSGVVFPECGIAWLEEELDTPSEPETPAPDPEEPDDSEEIIHMYGVYLCNPLNMSYYDILLMADGSTLYLFTPTQAGYDFVGWFDSDGKQYYDGQTMEIHEDMTLYAHFERQTSGAASEPEETTITLQIGSPYMTLNGRRQAIDSLGTAPIARNNRTLLPVRAVIEGLGGTVGWDAENQVVPLTMDGKTLYLKLGSQTAWDSSGKYYSLDSEPIALNNRTYLPIRFVVEYFGGSVGWEPDTQTVKITN